MTRNIKISIGKQYLDYILIVSDSHGLIYYNKSAKHHEEVSASSVLSLKHLVDYQFVSL